MKKNSKIKLIVLLIVLALFVYGGLYVYSLSQVRVVSVDVNQLQDIGLSGFTLGGDIEIYNGGLVPLGIDHLDYFVTLENNGRELASGRIDGGKIPPRKTVSYPLSTRISWIPTSQVAWGLITPGATYAKVAGTVYVADLKIIDFKVPFSTRVNIEQYIRQFAKAKIQQAAQKVADTTRNIGESIVDTGSKIVEGIKNLFS
jgi:hypothetical protein